MAEHYKKESKFLSYVLRHHPEKINIHRDEYGWVNVDELLEKFPKYHNMDIVRLGAIVDTDSKKRYSFNVDKSRIKANYGHSGDVKTECIPNEPPLYLYHGTKVKFLDSIKEKGVQRMTRTAVHLSETIETAKLVAQRRNGESIILRIKAKEMYDAGHRFVKCTNDLWLTDHVDFNYLELNWKG